MTLTTEQARERETGRAWDRDKPITKVTEHESDWDIQLDGTGFILSKERLGDADPPAVGDLVTLYTRQGSWIRGVDLRGEPLYYKTDAEMDAEHEQWVAEKKERDKQKFEEQRAELDAKFDALPEAFQRRVAWFRDHNPDFRWEYEAYELSSCVDAVKIVEAMKTEAKVRRFGKASHKKQQEMIPDLAYDRHSGNSFDFACRLAHLYVQNPLFVIAEHGAMVPLTGCEDYGCAHPRPDDVLEALTEAPS